MSPTSRHSGSLEQQKPTWAPLRRRFSHRPGTAQTSTQVLWLVPATLVQEAVKGKGKGKGDKGSKGNTGSHGDKGSMGHEGSKGGKAHTGGGCSQCTPQLAAIAESLWQSGSLHVALSAPRTTYGRWRIKFEPPVAPEMAGQVLVFTLDWVGNIMFYHECMRRAMSEPQSVGPLIRFCVDWEDHLRCHFGVRADPAIQSGLGAAQRV